MREEFNKLILRALSNPATPYVEVIYNKEIGGTALRIFLNPDAYLYIRQMSETQGKAIGVTHTDHVLVSCRVVMKSWWGSNSIKGRLISILKGPKSHYNYVQGFAYTYKQVYDILLELKYSKMHHRNTNVNRSDYFA